MTWRKGHGRGAGVPRIEVLPADELPAPVPAQAAPVNRRQNGTVSDSESAKALGRKGGVAKASRARLVSALGLSALASDAEFTPYRDAGDEFVRHHLAALAARAGGEVGPGPSSIVASAGLQLAASRFVSDKAAKSGDAKLFHLASTLANDSRQNLLAAYELAVREAGAKPRATGLDALRSKVMKGGT
ncbi:hypothetical protein AKJ09_11225 [Labilithrix luteola]|uniref:Uncharacterized protein n=1 Tax=Labilithrix luteola TaxID=1391654 RepID=A0A0K1QFX5_9BACT|nr:hypothetical protein [Labilithrix luteola]AKV04562.1 hypothetical protein AKJ09_11225 [Labilithrix luteola]